MQKSCYSYPVELVDDAFGETPVLANLLKQISGAASPRILIVADMNVVQRTEGLGSKIGRYVKEHGLELAASPVVMVGGEKIKADNLQSAISVATAILAAKLGKNDIVLALGGGTLLDVAGYAAAQVRGGVKIVRMPTTPAAMMNAAFADYAAVDSSSVKDALRVSSVPAAVVIDRTFGLTVMDGVWRSGVGEAVRAAVATDATLLKKLQNLLPDYCKREAKAYYEVVSEVVKVRLKKGGTSLGQWGALRLESMSCYKLPHGYAVSIGLWLDLGYAVEKGLMKAADREKVVKLMVECGATDGLNHSSHLLNQPENLLLGLDAWKLAAGSPAIHLPAGIGKTVEEPEPDRETIRKVVAAMLAKPVVEPAVATANT